MSIQAMPLTVGQRVMVVPLGPGTILGFEIFVDNGNRSALTDVDDGTGRVLVQLDVPGKWTLSSESQPHPYIYRSQLQYLNET